MNVSSGPTPPLSTHELSVGYGHAGLVLQDINVQIPAGKTTAIVGANGCGKSTLLKTLAGLIKPAGGCVQLSGTSISRYSRRQVAQTLAYLPQSAVVPDGVTVRDLVARGRHPHQSWLRQWSPADDAVVERAMQHAGCAGLADRLVAKLSGGQRQRAWLGLVLAQGAQTLLLDEPTTFLDLPAALEVLRTVKMLTGAGQGTFPDSPILGRDPTEVPATARTVVMVLHDINLAARFADHMICLGSHMHSSASRIIAEGAPAQIITPELLNDVFGLRARVIPDPVTGGPLVVPEE
ncbi:ABC transporter ATP-binding protein [Corynebacterium auriscanis]|uniref:ABC transporter ATP-binding protein n=1 Tax=Corynebacterium auriscanis TaxID=99807 RepID=UPI003CEF3BF2